MRDTIAAADEIVLAEDIVADLGNRLPANELGRLSRLLQLRRSVAEAKKDLDALAAEREHFVRSGQTQRYAREMSAVLRRLLDKQVDGHAALRVLGWTRKLLQYRDVAPYVPRPSGPAPAGASRASAGRQYQPSTKRGERRDRTGRRS
jgi:hypothetical protein